MTWYYKDEDKEIGPVTKTELQRLVKKRKITADTMVRREGATAWRPLVAWVQGKPAEPTAAATPEAGGAAPEAAPPPPRKPEPPKPPPGETPAPAASRNSSASPQIPFEFNGSGGEYFKIWIVNVLLSIVTLGIYSAWAKVRRKQYFYGNTVVDGASFQYLADPVKILKGRIIVFFGFLVYSMVNRFFPIFSVLFILVFLPLLPWFVVRALCFNARNSALRNIRFNFRGTYWQAAKVFIFWPMLVPFTLGILSPYIFYRQKKFVVDNSAYGTTPFEFKATAKDYYILVLKLLLPFAVFALIGAAAGYFAPPSVALVFALSYLYALAYFVVKSSNLLYNSCDLSGHRFRATMAIKDFVLIVVTNTLATVVTLGFFHPFAQVRAYRYKISQLALVPAGDLDQFVAGEQEQVSALGDEMADFMDFDFGL